ncbi:MAG: hypothetical protein QXS43_12015 [Metallosphaera sp.]|uniref:hypothetical protein n=1 Tax=Metallosphaera sp. TaxID=2020860 RepID=UPI003176D062
MGKAPEVKPVKVELTVVTPILAPSPHLAPALKERELQRIVKWWKDHGVEDEQIAHLDRWFERTADGNIFMSTISLSSALQQAIGSNVFVQGLLVFPPDALTIRAFSIVKNVKPTLAIAEAILPGTKVETMLMTNISPTEVRAIQIAIGWRKSKGYGNVLLQFKEK